LDLKKSGREGVITLRLAVSENVTVFSIGKCDSLQKILNIELEI